MHQTYFLNHASVLHKYKYKNNFHYFLLDPWYQKPAFGSWLPSYRSSINPELLIALSFEDRLSIVISHGHDDHLDDDYLSLFSKDTPIYIPKFNSPGVINRIKKNQFSRIYETDSKGISIHGINIANYINFDYNQDDSIFVISNSNFALVHANDNWAPLEKQIYFKIFNQLKNINKRSILYMSQTNSASGYPLTLKNITRNERRKKNYEKVKKMVSGSVSNCKSLGVSNFLSYAGYASVYIKGKTEYLKDSINPTKSWIDKNVDVKDVSVLDMMPGDYFDHLSGQVQKSFVSESLYLSSYSLAIDKFYEFYGHKKSLDSFKYVKSSMNNEIFLEHIKFFLNQFNQFCTDRFSRITYFSEMKGKTFSIIVDKKSYEIEFGKLDLKISEDDSQALQSVYVSRPIMEKILDGSILFENLITGFAGQWVIKNEYNRDVNVAITMYSYFYVNRILSSAKIKSI